MRYILIAAIALTLAVGYNWYLNHGCETAGLMTINGKQCLDDITR